jgi:hypothetical protein
MRSYQKKCTYCKEDKQKCNHYHEQRTIFKKLSSASVKSISVNCSYFEPIAKAGDIIQFQMNDGFYKKQVIHATDSGKTFFVILAKTSKNREIFTREIFDYYGEILNEKKYFIEDYFGNNSFMAGIVNYKYVTKVIKNQELNEEKLYKFKSDNSCVFDFLKGDK